MPLWRKDLTSAAAVKSKIPSSHRIQKIENMLASNLLFASNVLRKVLVWYFQTDSGARLALPDHQEPD